MYVCMYASDRTKNISTWIYMFRISNYIFTHSLFISIHKHLHARTYLCVWGDSSMHTITHVRNMCMCVYIHICVLITTYVFIYMHMYVENIIYICMCVIHKHIHIIWLYISIHIYHICINN